MNNSSEGNVDAGFSVVNVTQVGGSYPCSVHEIGHCLWLGHGALQTANKAAGIFQYSYGWSWIGATENEAGTYKYCSVMSYFGAENYADGIRGVNVPYFSSPDVTFDGQPAGSAGVADAARSVNETKHLVACYSDILGRRTAAPSGFRIKSVSCNGVSAEWNAVAGASSYRFYFKEAGASYWSYYPDLTGAAFSMDYAGVFKTGVEYTCYAAAVNACGEAGDISAVATFTPACPSSVTSVTVAPASATVAKGDTRQFAATVNGSGNPAQTVTWSVDGGSASTVSAAGLLAVDAAETAATLTVRAVAAADPARYGTATVTVTAAPVRYTLALSPNIAARGSVSGGGTFAGGASVTATATPKTGYYFTEWTENGTRVSASAEYSFALSADRTLTAHFEPVIYSITYVLNGGSGVASSDGYTVESARITLPEPAREGYVFRGWYTSADFSGVSVSVIPAGSTGDRTFHAKWEAELRLSDDVEMIPAYHPSIFNYTASVPHEKTRISLITRNGAVLRPYPLQIVENIITYTETATGAMHTRAEVRYTIVVTRSAGDTRNAAIAGNGIRVYTRGSTLNVSAAAAIRSVEIYAVTGSLIRRQEPGSAETAVHNLPRGIYIARIVLENEQAGLIKVIVN